MGFLIDSNIVIYYLNNSLPEAGMLFMHDIINNTPFISVMTEIEVLGFNNPPDAEALLREFISISNIIPLSKEIIDTTIAVKKAYKIKTPDAIIAASAI